MKSVFIIQNVFRFLLLLVLIFRLFFIKFLNFYWDLTTYIILGISLVCLIIVKILLFIYKKK